ncbi:hypothetical protein [Agromyces sp. NBRC 114283]|uniref:hypothetical protein n=1 Tax=Agromyces sp. NBRC 114283 TaxID=2994521 RepID=UPI0024A48718|nr:hypothetical protein [Agromyces sp. NBRC 114283]GLU90939.1 hypothetical protein Agsp01_31940 [Agromyces sp. NBRC 114283]
MDKPEPDSVSDAHFVIRAKTLSVAAGIAALAAIAALVTVIGVTGSDALAAVAIALAILAFLVQIIVLVADLMATNARDEEARRINADSRALLARVEIRTEQTSTIVSEQLAKLLDAVLVSTKPAVDGSSATIDDVREALKTVRSETLGDAKQAAGAARVSLVRIWPSASTLERLIAQGIQQLPDLCFPLLDILAMDLVSSYQQGIPEGRVMDTPMYAEAAAALVANGYATQNEIRLVLTHKGIEAASLIAAYDPVPDYVLNLWPDLPAVRQRSQR